VVVIDDEVHGKMTAQETLKAVEKLK